MPTPNRTRKRITWVERERGGMVREWLKRGNTGPLKEGYLGPDAGIEMKFKRVQTVGLADKDF